MAKEKKAVPVILHGAQYWKVDDEVYLKMGDRLAKVHHFDENHKPVIKTWSEEKPNESGGQDCTIHVESLQIAGKAENI